MDHEIKTFCVGSDKVNIDMELALRFLRVRRAPDDECRALLESCVEEFEREVSYKACYRLFDIKIDGNKVYFGDEMVLQSEKLSKNLNGCDKAVVFVSTLGSKVDRLIMKHSKLMLSRCLVLDAIGSAAVEGFCNLLCSCLESEYGISFRPRFSPGYGDLSILCQTQVLSVCDCMRKIGVTLTDNHMMLPRKSVSAIVGVRPKSEKCDKASNCEYCDSTDCPYRE